MCSNNNRSKWLGGQLGESATRELACAQGLIHISELSWSVVLTPDAVVQPGSLVRCKVKRVDRDKSQIQLSLKVPRPAARWQNVSAAC